MKSCILVVGALLNCNVMLLCIVCDSLLKWAVEENEKMKEKKRTGKGREKHKGRLLFSLLSRVNYMGVNRDPLAKWRGTSDYRGL